MSQSWGVFVQDYDSHTPPKLGAITFVYSITKRGWVFPGLSVIRNPLKAQRLAEKINNKQEDI